MSTFNSNTVSPNQTATAAQYNDLREDTIRNAGDFAVATGSGNAYAITVDAQIDALAAGDVFKFKANHTNTGASTLNVNSFGAVDIKKDTNTNLENEDIQDGQIIVVVYDGTNFQIVSNTDTPNSVLRSIFTAGENGNAGDSLCVGTGVEYPGATNNASPVGSYTITNGNFLSQTFLTSIKAFQLIEVSINIASGGSDDIGVRLTIRETSGGIPTNTVVTGSTVEKVISPSPASNTFTFSSPIDISPNTTYAISIERDNSIEPITSGNSASVQKANGGYADGSVYTSSDGSSWSSDTGDFAVFEIIETYTIAGRVYKTDTTNNDEFANNFIGFANEDFTNGNFVVVNIIGIDTNQTGLNVGSTYYLQDTAGTIGTSTGSQSRKIGRAIDTNNILIINENI